jgi:maltooligosyltrehalose trehalohydrolase
MFVKVILTMLGFVWAIADIEMASNISALSSPSRDIYSKHQEASSSSKEEEHFFQVWAPAASSVTVKPRMQSSWRETQLTKISGSEYWGAYVASVKPGDCYVFVIDGKLTRIDPKAQDIASDWSCSIIPHTYHWKSRRVTVHRRAAIIYELHIPSFTDLGTFAAAAERLDYLVNLGINVIELLPVTLNSKDDNWGYSPVAPYAVAPELVDRSD